MTDSSLARQQQVSFPQEAPIQDLPTAVVIPAPRLHPQVETAVAGAVAATSLTLSSGRVCSIRVEAIPSDSQSEEHRFESGMEHGM